VLQCVAVGVLQVYYSAFAVCGSVVQCAATRLQGVVFSKSNKSQISKVSSRLYLLYTMTKELMNFWNTRFKVLVRFLPKNSDSISQKSTQFTTYVLKENFSERISSSTSKATIHTQARISQKTAI